MTNLSKPPEHLRDVGGWHWVRAGTPEAPIDEVIKWLPGLQDWEFIEYSCGCTYIAPVATPAEVDALRAEIAKLRPAPARTALAPAPPAAPDPIAHPPHYTQHPSGVECIQITEHMGFCLGNVIKYVWRAGLKGDEVEDLRKAAWYLQREIERRGKK